LGSCCERGGAQALEKIEEIKMDKNKKSQVGALLHGWAERHPLCGKKKCML
jgi:hypothetical protein